MKGHVMRLPKPCLHASFVLALSLAPATALAQTTWYVDDDAPNDPGPGDPAVSDPDEDGSESHPFDAIQEGVNASVSGDTIIVLDGDYDGSGNANIGFGGRAVTVRSANGPETCRIVGQRAFRIVAGETRSTVIRGLTINTSISGTWGGGVYLYNCSPTFEDCIIDDCFASQQGAAVLCEYGGSPLFVDCTLLRNTMIVHESEMGGGAVYIHDADPVFVRCRFLRNTVTGDFTSLTTGGGAVHVFSGTPTFVNCRFEGNQCHSSHSNAPGGAILSSGSTVLINCSFVGNASGLGGAIVDMSSTGLTAVNCTLVGNVANSVAAIVGFAPTQLRNTIVWDDGSTPPVTMIHVDALAEYCCVRHCTGLPWAGTGCIDTPPLLVRDPDPGLDGIWGTLDDDYGDVRLSAGSPSIDAADSTALPADVFDLDEDDDTTERVPVDLDGAPRVVDDPDSDDTGVGDPCVDMGAYEFRPEPACPGDLDGDDDTDLSDLGILLASWELDDGGDLDGDGDTDLSDLGILLADWNCGT
jgi:hypothetical protein